MQLTRIILTYTIIPIAAMLVGGVIATLRAPGPKLSSSIQHFAAGLIFAAVATELLPEVKEQAPLVVIIGFTLGTIAMVVMRWLLEHTAPVTEGQPSSERPNALEVAVGVDLAIDGLLLGVAFAVGEAQGILLTFALAAELLSLGLATSVTLPQAKGQGRRNLVTLLGLGLLFLLGAVVGALLLSQVSATILVGVTAFGIAALLYLVTEELLVEAHEVPDTPFSVGMFFAGFLLLLVIEMI